MENLSIEQQLSKEDYAKFVDFSIFDRKPFNKIFLLILAPILGVALLILFFAMGEESNTLFIVLCIFLIVLGWGMKFVFKWLSNRNYDKNPFLGMKTIIAFKDEQVETITKRGKMINKYIDVDRAYVVKDYIVVYYKNQQFLGIKTDNMQQSVKQQIVSILKGKCLGKVVVK